MPVLIVCTLCTNNDGTAYVVAAMPSLGAARDVLGQGLPACEDGGSLLLVKGQA